jgi:O-antigen/teichoic acid export membrane protein
VSELRPEAETRRFGRTASLLSAGVGAAGLLTYLFFSLASHNLDKHQYGEIVVLWSAVFVTISVAHRPVEQMLTRTLAERRARGEEIDSALRVGAAIQLGVAILLGALALALRDPLQDGLLSGSETLYWVLVFAVTTFGVSYYARGVFAGTRRFVLLAALLVCESRRGSPRSPSGSRPRRRSAWSPRRSRSWRSAAGSATRRTAPGPRPSPSPQEGASRPRS